MESHVRNVPSLQTRPSREASLDGIHLAELPPGAMLLGGEHHILTYGLLPIEEQYPTYLPKIVKTVAWYTTQHQPVESVEVEALLLARYGISTWGHWLGELLPKAVLAETVHPGRFYFVLPSPASLGGGQPVDPTERILESLAAYGIDAGRIITVKPDRNYRFEKLFGVTPVWSDHLLHPAIGHIMRSRLQGSRAGTRQRRIAVDRNSAFGRVLENSAEIDGVLRGAGFTFLSNGCMAFREQVAAIAGAEVVFGVLGSDLANLIFAPTGVRVVSVAPHVFGDRFFYALILDRAGELIDLRGPITRLNDAVAHRSTFTIDKREVEKALSLFL